MLVLGTTLFGCVTPAPVVPGAGSETGMQMPANAATPVRGIARSPRKARIVNPTSEWPRTVEDVNGPVTIPQKPLRIHTLSVGYDEITFRLVESSRIIAVGRSTTNPELSNVSEEARGIPNQVGRDAEEVIALNPDLVVGSPFSNPDLLAHIRNAGIPLVVADLVSSIDAHEENIRFLAYLYGEEERGEGLIHEVRIRLDRLADVAGGKAESSRQRVLILEGSSTPGSGTNEDGILRLAGARNAAAEAGVVGNRQINIEAILVADPDWIVLAQPSPDRPSLAEPLLQSAGLAGLRAIREGRVIRVKSSLLNTLSYWNVAGAEELERLLRGSSGTS